MSRITAVLSLILILGCTTTSAPPAQPPSEFRNLQVLPKTITRPELLATMRSFTRALGVRCNECHVVTATTPKEEFDFPADTKEEKRVARVMIQMVQQINGPFMDRVERAEGEEPHAGTREQKVFCWTCHRGNKEPETPPPPPAPGEPSR